MAKKVIALSSSMVEKTRAPQRGEPDEPTGQGAPLNFRVPPAFRTRFRVYAAKRGLRLNQVLEAAFEALVRDTGE